MIPSLTCVDKNSFTPGNKDIVFEDDFLQDKYILFHLFLYLSFTQQHRSLYFSIYFNSL